MQQAPSEADHIEAFRSAMRDAGVPYTGDVEGDGKLRRIYVEGDRRGSRNGWYVLNLDERPAGGFGTMKGEQKFKWSAKGLKPLTREEREEIARRTAEKKAASERAEAERQAAAAVAANAMWEAAYEVADHPYLTRKGVPGYGLRVGEWVKDLLPDENGQARQMRVPGALLIPLRDERRNIVSLQAIFAKPLAYKGEERGKDFVYGGRKRGCWFTIGKPTEVDGVVTIVICEGYATGASIHRATGLAVVVAFDGGNLLPCAETARRLMPDARILIAGDNDAWTVIAGEPRNIGVEKARAAAEAVGGLWIVPEFDDVSSKPTDFNDLDALEGLDRVREMVMGALRPPAPPPAEDDGDPGHEDAPWSGEPQFDSIDPDDNGHAGPTVEDDDISTDGFFRVLGHDRTHIYVYQYRMKLILHRSQADWGEAALMTLAPLQWWEREFPGEKGMNRKMAHNWLLRTAEAKGFFDPNCRRGRGAWRDDGRFVYHFGDRLAVDGVMQDGLKISSNNVYEQARRMRLPGDEPMTGAEGRLILEACQAFHWSRPASAILLAGWCALAPLCGAFRWRPHIWITGGPGSGKSTILEAILWLMNGAAIYAQGNSTEAGIRQTLKIDSLPVLWDESEQNNDREQMRVQSVIALIRQASTESEAKTLKGTQGGEAMDFIIRSMFCLSSVQVGLKHQADVERLTVLSLRPKSEGKDSAAENWKRISGTLAALRADPALPGRMMRRSMDLLPTTLQNIEIFAQAAAEAFGSQRDGDQYGAMLAGAWSLFKSTVATIEEARAMIARYDWSDYLEGQETDESAKALSALLGTLVRVKGSIEVSIYELVAAAAGRSVDTCDVSEKEATGILRRYGIQIDWPTSNLADATLLIAYPDNVPELAGLMEHTPYAADIKGQLLRIPGATRVGARRFLATRSRCVGIPMTAVLDGLVRMPVDDFGDDIPF